MWKNPKLFICRSFAYLIAFIAFANSYVNQVTLLTAAAVTLVFAYALPLTIDLLAFIAATIHNADDVDPAGKRASLLTMIFAGCASIAANLIEGQNWVQRGAGVWAVCAYLVAEYLASKAKRKAAEATTTVTAEQLAERYAMVAVTALLEQQAADRRANAAKAVATKASKVKAPKVTAPRAPRVRKVPAFASALVTATPADVIAMFKDSIAPVSPAPMTA